MIQQTKEDKIKEAPAHQILKDMEKKVWLSASDLAG